MISLLGMNIGTYRGYTASLANQLLDVQYCQRVMVSTP